MIPKQSRIGYLNQDTKITLLNTYSKGFDTDQLQKVASEETIKYENWTEVTPVKGKSYIHVVTLGAGEFYGPNSRGDYYNEGCRSVTAPMPEDPSCTTIVLRGGLKDFHKTYMENGSVYRDHNNGVKGYDALGNIFAERYNNKAHRGELILELDNTKFSDIIEKIANKVPVFLSQGSGVPEDICSICHHRAKRISDHCDHVRYNNLGITKDGNQVFVYNDKPMFHDISFVKVPADRIAFGLKKVASDIDPLSYKDLYIPTSVMHKYYYGKLQDRASLLHKLASEEAKVCEQGIPEELKEVFAMSPEESEDITTKLSAFGVEDILKGLIDEDMVLPPDMFCKTILKDEEDNIGGLKGTISKLIKSLSSDMDVASEIIEDGSYVPTNYVMDPGVHSVCSDIAGSLAINEESIPARIIKNTISGHSCGCPIEDPVEPTRDMESKAKEYVKYIVSALEQNPDPSRIKMVVVQNNS